MRTQVSLNCGTRPVAKDQSAKPGAQKRQDLDGGYTRGCGVEGALVWLVLLWFSAVMRAAAVAPTSKWPGGLLPLQVLQISCVAAPTSGMMRRRVEQTWKKIRGGRRGTLAEATQG